MGREHAYPQDSLAIMLLEEPKFYNHQIVKETKMSSEEIEL